MPKLIITAMVLGFCTNYISLVEINYSILRIKKFGFQKDLISLDIGM